MNGRVRQELNTIWTMDITMEANIAIENPAELPLCNDDAKDAAFFNKNLFIFCDGTWCGTETGTRTNVRILYEFVKMRTGRCAYFSGVGLGGDEADYIVNGAFAVDLKEKCIEVYSYIVREFRNSDDKIWMFGLSRGAFTVRSVAGMINNLGILRVVDNNTPRMCEKVFDLYKYDLRLDVPLWHPKSEAATAFRHQHCHHLNRNDPPIHFMGLFDTVGSLGVPTHFGEQLPYEFYDTIVSSSVKNVYQCAAIHDRLQFFQPCSISRSSTIPEDFCTEECWVPGCHYDVGRQRFKFGVGFLTWVARGLKVLRPDIVPEILPNHEWADVALNWIVGKMVQHDFPDPRHQRQVAETLSNPDASRAHWKGDVYDELLKHYGIDKYKSLILGDRILPPPRHFQMARFDGPRSLDYKSKSLDDYRFLYPANEPVPVPVESFQLPERIPESPPNSFADKVKQFVEDVVDAVRRLLG